MAGRTTTADGRADRTGDRDLVRQYLDELRAYPAVIASELDRYLPFLATTKVMMAAVKAGVGRETAHEAIKGHALDIAAELREHGTDRNDLLERLAADPALNVDHSALEQLVRAPLEFTGAARTQIAEVVGRVEKVAAEYADAAAYHPAPIL